MTLSSVHASRAVPAPCLLSPAGATPPGRLRIGARVLAAAAGVTGAAP